MVAICGDRVRRAGCLNRALQLGFAFRIRVLRILHTREVAGSKPAAPIDDLGLRREPREPRGPSWVQTTGRGLPPRARREAHELRRARRRLCSLLSDDDVIAAAGAAAVRAYAPPGPDGRGGRDCDAEVCGVRAPQVPDVFVCGTAREDGLRIYAGRVGDSALIASPWTPQSDDPACVGGARLPKRVRDRICRPRHADRCPRVADRRAP